MTTDQLISERINTTTQYANIVTSAIEKENMQDQRKIKIALWLFLHTSKLMCSMNSTQYTTKSVVSLMKDYRINTRH
jgi:hypothetical protein